MNTRLALALLAAASMGIWAVWPAPPRADRSGTTAREEQPPTSGEPLRSVEARLSRVERAQSSPLIAAAAVQPSAAEPATQLEPPAAPAKSSAELEAEYEERFQADALDSRASRDTSQRLAEALALPGFAGSSLQGVRCGRSLCRMDVRHDDALAKERFVDAFPTAVPWQTTGLIRFVDEHESHIYLATPPL
jgi:hypothetical protein